VGLSGELQLLSDQLEVVPSPDGAQALFVKDADIWLLDLLDGERRNLTETPDRIESDPQWWPARPESVVFHSKEPIAPGQGMLSLIDISGDNYLVLSDEASRAPSGLSPDRQMIAFDKDGTPWLHTLGEGSQPFDMAAYGLDGFDELVVGIPAWSPDGTRLAWWVKGEGEGASSSTLAIAVFDLVSQTAQIVHPYTPLGGSWGWLPAPVWSPSGEWLAFVSYGEVRRADVWVTHLNSGEEHHLGWGDRPTWRPDGGGWGYRSYENDLEGTYLVEIGRWEPQPLDLPPRSYPLQWRAYFTPQDVSAVPVFAPLIVFATQPELAQSQVVFPYGTQQIYALWSYTNMQPGMTIRREWYQNGNLWLVREEPWDFEKYGAAGVVRDISVYDFVEVLESGLYELRLFIDGVEQRLGVGEAFTQAIFEISAPANNAPLTSPDGSLIAAVRPPGTLLVKDAAGGQRELITVSEISSFTWHPDGQHIIFGVRSREDQDPRYGPVGIMDELWVVDVQTDAAQPILDIGGQSSTTGLHDPLVSPGGRYIAAIGGTGWGDACYVDSELWVKQVEFVGDELRETYSYFQHGFAPLDLPENEHAYLESILFWENASQLQVELKWACSDGSLDGVYRFDLSSQTVERVSE
jgi:Tol biopolymer transport system component